VPSLRKIAVIGCGGTISSEALHSLDMIDYPEYGTKLKVEDVLARVPEAPSVADVTSIAFRARGSSSFGPAEWTELRALVEARAPQVEGIVILHGTATLEETAYFLHLTLRVTIPVVVVGSQRPINAVSSDAGMNLINALRVASDSRMSKMGVAVVLNDAIHCARDVVKTSNYRLETFASPLYGPLGYVEPDGVHIDRMLTRRHAPDTYVSSWSPEMPLPRVDVVYSCAGTDGMLIDAVCQAGAKGIVSIGLAPGLPTPAESAALKRAMETGVHVVQTSRAHGGYIPRRKYLRDNRILSGDDLSPAKCRVLLMLGLTQNDKFEYLEELFATH
jgi:L-asparaginase